MDIANLARRIIKATGLGQCVHALVGAYARVRPHHVCTRGGITYDLDLSEVIDRSIFLGGWEPETVHFLRSTIQSGDVVIEVGANVGAHTLILAERVGAQGSVYAFEPTEFARAKLETNLRLNPKLAGRIVVRTELVTNHEHATPNLSLRSSFPVDGPGRPDEMIDARSMALDDLQLSRLDLLKIDVDGYDYKVLQGSTAIIDRLRPRVLIELCEYTLAAQGDSVRDIFALLDGLGYCATRGNAQPITVDEVLGIVGNHTSINAVFHPVQPHGTSGVLST